MPDDFTPILRWTPMHKVFLSEAEQVEMRDLIEEMKRLNPSGRVHCDPNDPSMGGALNWRRLIPRHEAAEVLTAFFNLASIKNLNTPRVDKVRLNPGPHTITLTFNPSFEK